MAQIFFNFTSAVHEYNYADNYGAAPQQAPSWGMVPYAASQPAFPSSPHGQPNNGAGYNYGQSSYEAYCERQEQDVAAEPRKMAALEVEEDPRKVARAEKRKVKIKAERKKQKLEDAMNATRILCFMGVWNAFMWALPAFGDSWNTRMFAGFGIGFLRISTSLLAIHVELQCDKKGFTGEVENKLCELFAQLNGTSSLHQAKDLACSFHFNHESCAIMDATYNSSWFLLFGFMLSALTSILGGVFLYYYWFNSPLKKIRQYAMGCFLISPSFGVLAFAGYSIIAPDLGDIPRTWSSVMFAATGGIDIFKIKAVGEENVFSRCGWCWFFCFVTIAFSIAGALVFVAFFKKHSGEKEEEKALRREKRHIERELENLEERTAEAECKGFGGVGYDTSAPAYDDSTSPYAATDQAVPLHQAAYPPGGGAAYSPSAAAGYACDASGYSGQPPGAQGGYLQQPAAQGGYAQGGYPPTAHGGYPPSSQGTYQQSPPGSYPPSSPAVSGGYPGYSGYPQYQQ